MYLSMINLLYQADTERLKLLMSLVKKASRGEEPPEFELSKLVPITTAQVIFCLKLLERLAEMGFKIAGRSHESHASCFLSQGLPRAQRIFVSTRTSYCQRMQHEKVWFKNSSVKKVRSPSLIHLGCVCIIMWLSGGYHFLSLWWLDFELWICHGI